MDGLSVPVHGFRVLTGTGNEPLAAEIAEQLGIPLCKRTINRFADGEVFVRIDENIRGADIFIVQPTNPPAENVIELLLMVDELRWCCPTSGMRGRIARISRASRSGRR
jgi:phosphoribosylpyrophosphate synthetase